MSSEFVDVTGFPGAPLGWSRPDPVDAGLFDAAPGGGLALGWSHCDTCTNPVFGNGNSAANSLGASNTAYANGARATHSSNLAQGCYIGCITDGGSYASRSDCIASIVYGAGGGAGTAIGNLYPFCYDAWAWSKNDPVPMVIFENGLRIYVGSFHLRTTPGLQSVTGLGFQPHAVLFLGASRDGGNDFGSSFEVGAMDADGNQWATAYRSHYGSGPTFVGGEDNRVERYSQFLTDSCLFHIGSGQLFLPDTYTQQAAFDSMDADGFTIDVLQAQPVSNGDLHLVRYAAFVPVYDERIAQDRAAITVGWGTQGDPTIVGAPAGCDAILLAGSAAPDDNLQTFGCSALGLVARDGDGNLQNRGRMIRAASGALGAGPPLSTWDSSDTYALLWGGAQGRVGLGSTPAITWDLDTAPAPGFFRPKFGWIAFASAPTLRQRPVIEEFDVVAACGTARFRAVINPRTFAGDFVRASVQWGPTITYGNEIIVNFYDGSDPVEFFANLSGLTVGATYHARVHLLGIDCLPASPPGDCDTYSDDLEFTVGDCDFLTLYTEENTEPFLVQNPTILETA